MIACITRFLKTKSGISLSPIDKSWLAIVFISN